jgi:hypothetical protein
MNLRSGLRAACTVAAFSLAPQVSAQTPQRQTPAGSSGTGLILGQIVDADTNRGIGGALVMLSPSAPPATPVGELTEARTPGIGLQALAGVQRTLATAAGHFVFRDLPRGQFSLTATAPTHLLGGYGQLRPQGPALSLALTDGEKKGAGAIRLWRLGSIAGVVRDDRGEAMVGVSVECLRRVIAGGQKRYASQGALTYTDDRGIYRAGNLPPGEYVCGVTQNTTTTPASILADDPTAAGAAGPPSKEAQRLTNSGGTILSSSGMRLGPLVFSSGASPIRGASVPPPDANGRLMAFAPVFHPSASTPSQAIAIALKAGEERSGVDLVMKLVPAVTVSGTVSAPTGQGSYLSLRLVPASGGDYASEGQAEYSRTVSDPAGAFAFLGVPAGQYVIKSRYYPRPAPGGNLTAALDEMSLWTATPVTVGDKDLTNLSVMMRPGIRATGRVEFSGSRAAPAAADVARIAIRMQNAEGRTSSPISLDGRVAADGSFKTTGYPAGRYIANVLPTTVPAGWSVKSITYNGRDISVEPVELGDSDLSGVVVTFTDKTTSLFGTVVTDGSGPATNAEVVVFPADSVAWKDIGVVARRSRVERVSEIGAYSITGLPPGDYFVAAIAGSRPGDRQDPSLLAELTSATRVTLADGGNHAVQLIVRR